MRAYELLRFYPRICGGPSSTASAATATTQPPHAGRAALHGRGRPGDQVHLRDSGFIRPLWRVPGPDIQPQALRLQQAQPHRPRFLLLRHWFVTIREK